MSLFSPTFLTLVNWLLSIISNSPKLAYAIPAFVSIHLFARDRLWRLVFFFSDAPSLVLIRIQSVKFITLSIESTAPTIASPLYITFPTALQSNLRPLYPNLARGYDGG